jgi:hypothetical protein
MDLTKLIDWNTAPEWAMFATFDSNGQLWWHEHEPGAMIFGWRSPYANSRMEKGTPTKVLWTQTLQKRPDVISNITLAKQLTDNFLESWNKLTPELQEMFKLQYKDQLSELKKFIY